MAVVDKYARYCSNASFNGLPDEVIDYAKVLLEDYVGVAIGGGEYSPSADSLIEGVNALHPGTVHKRGGTVLATGNYMHPQTAAFLNGSLAHSLDFDDTEAGHPGAPIISAALAMAEREHATGADLLSAIVTGYEITCRLYRAVNLENHYARGFHPTATCGLFGATAAACKILDATETMAGNAFGINISQASGTHGYIRNGGWNKRIHPGIAAHGAIVSTTLAEAGFQGTAKPFEGYQTFFHAYTSDPDLEAATASLGDMYRILDTGIKPYPCCRRMHTAIDVALSLTIENDIDAREVNTLIVEAPEATVETLARPLELKERPSNLFEAQFSMQFGVALAVARRDAGLRTFIGEMEGGPGKDIERLINRTTIVARLDGSSEIESNSEPVSININTASKTYSGAASLPRGDPENLLSESERNGKFDELTTKLSENDRRELVGRIRSIEKHDVDEVFGPIRGRC